MYRPNIVLSIILAFGAVQAEAKGTVASQFYGFSIGQADFAPCFDMTEGRKKLEDLIPKADAECGAIVKSAVELCFGGVNQYTVKGYEETAGIEISSAETLKGLKAGRLAYAIQSILCHAPQAMIQTKCAAKQQAKNGRVAFSQQTQRFNVARKNLRDASLKTLGQANACFGMQTTLYAVAETGMELRDSRAESNSHGEDAGHEGSHSGHVIDHRSVEKIAEGAWHHLSHKLHNTISEAFPKIASAVKIQLNLLGFAFPIYSAANGDVLGVIYGLSQIAVGYIFPAASNPLIFLTIFATETLSATNSGYICDTLEKNPVEAFRAGCREMILPYKLKQDAQSSHSAH